MKALKQKNIMRDEKGFTLIEIISVLLILGVLAANATPRLVDLTTSAREMAAVAAIAEVKARCSLTYAKQLLLANGNTTAVLPLPLVSRLTLMSALISGSELQSKGTTFL